MSDKEKEYNQEENLTRDEKEQLDNGDVATAEEEHRYAEFEALNSKVDELIGYAKEEFARLNDAVSLFVKNGGIVQENHSDNISSVVDSEAPDTSMEKLAEIADTSLEDMDFKIK